ncbi:hypothetical protein NUU61_009482 [Penicillium alfredii]|uniref:Uncharacterized protein n=1 Tax=Penicillium alfredii TaxID=1506179 RepID=A0A9W9EN57_9EURO|nr:uncharacterized protein NUU61_009482 [Penicillium alfredii]KAJ5084903.1 hypothetical protein NUU61_009482 [Penicillium alfredii]
MPRDPQRKNRLPKPANAATDEGAVFEIAYLIRRLGFKSDEIINLSGQSPNRLIAIQILLYARKSDRFNYNRLILDSLVDIISFGKAKDAL